MNPFEERVDACLRALEAACREDGAFITGDGRVAADTAAGLLHLAVSTLANHRSAGTGPAFYRNAGHPVTYRLHDLATWIEAGRCDPSRDFTQVHAGSRDCLGEGR